MKRPLRWFVSKELLFEDETMKNLSGNYMKKARDNIITMELLSKSPDFKNILSLPEDYSPDEWVVISAYYSMYMAALGVLAKLGYKSRNHSATIAAMDEFLVKKRLLEKRHIENLNDINIKKEEIQELENARGMREAAQYSVTKDTTQKIAEETRKDAHQFVDKMEEVLDLLKDL